MNERARSWRQRKVWGFILVALLFLFGESWAAAVPGLFGTYWRAIEIDGSAVTVTLPAREPHIVLRGKGNRVQGSTGCNRFSGSFVQKDDRFSFKPLAVTRMACPPPANALEQSFLGALKATSRIQQVGNILELRDDQGSLRMRLQAK